MNRLMMLVLCVLACAGVCAPAGAEDPPKKLTPEERKELAAKLKELSAAGLKARQAGKYTEAIKPLEESLKIARRLYPDSEFPNGHADLATSLSGLALLYQDQGNYTDAEPLFKESLGMRKRLFKGDHNDLATGLNELAALYREQGKLADAEPLYKEALGMRKRLFKGDRSDVADNLSGLALLYQEQGKYADAESLFKESQGMRKRLFKGDHNDLAASLNELAVLYREQGKLADAEPLFKEALEMTKRLFKGDHPDVATSLNNLAVMYNDLGKLADAESLFKEALEIYKRLFKGDHPYVAAGLNNLAALYQAQGKMADAEPLYKNALEMKKRLFKGDHPDLALSLNNLALAYRDQGKWADAEPLFKEALEMTKRLFKGDHSLVALSLNNLALVYRDQEKWADAEPLFKEALEMTKRLFKGDHPDTARSLNSLAVMYEVQRKYADAEPLFKESLEMYKRLFKGDHPDVVSGLNNLAIVYKDQEKWTAAESLAKEALDMYKRLSKDDHYMVALGLVNLAVVYKDQDKLAAAAAPLKEALGMYKRLTTTFAQDKTEGETLTLLAQQPLVRDAYLSIERARATPPAAVYPQLWADKGNVARAYERRQLQARAAAADPRAAAALADLTDARRRRAELLLAPATHDPATLKKRDADIKTYNERIEARTRELRNLLPAVRRADALAAANPAALQQALPADAALVDFVRYTFFARDNTKPVGEKETRTARYLAFVVTRDAVAWVDLGTATDIESAITTWRDAITGGKEIPDAIPAKVRERVWAPVHKHLPNGTKTVYICPDQALCKVPFAALPGDKPGTILLEDFALATVPHAPFLLDKLLPQDPLKNPPSGTLVVGGVKYDSEPAVGAVASRGNPLVKPDAKLAWSFLANTVGEANGVSEAATRKKLTATRLESDTATPAAVLAALPKAKYAHFATHGFFADASFRGIFQLDEKDYAMRGGERVGRAVNSPLLMTGLVFAGANNPKTPGRGVVTGESLIDLDLSGLELAVLSACETGLGDVAGGEGTFGLQRAFHYAGTTNVVASLWKVPDASTAALMSLFYRNLWDKNLSPMESLRQAQLELYRNPDKIPELAKGFRGKFEEVAGTGDTDIKTRKGGKAHPLLWAAFTLSGPGR